METASPQNEKTGLFPPKQAAALEDSEKREALAKRIAECVTRAFQAIGASSEMQEVIFWNILMTKNVARNQIIDKPREFMEGIKAIYGEAGTVVFEHMLTREIRREFNLTPPLTEQEVSEAEKVSEASRLIWRVALDS